MKTLTIKHTLGALLLIGAATTSTNALAMAPMNGAPVAQAGADVQKARWVCGPYGRCFWQPSYGYGYGYRPHPGWGYRPRPYYGGGYGWGHRGWGGHGWGGHRGWGNHW